MEERKYTRDHLIIAFWVGGAVQAAVIIVSALIALWIGGVIL